MAPRWRKWLGLGGSQDEAIPVAATDEPATSSSFEPPEEILPPSANPIEIEAVVEGAEEPGPAAAAFGGDQDVADASGEIDPWGLRGIPADDVPRWMEHDFTPDEAAEWRAQGCEHAFLADRWRKAGVNPIDAGHWITGKVSSPRDAALWTSAGWSAAVAHLWLVEGFRSPKVASQWSAAGFDPEDAKRWVDVGVSEADVALLLFCEDVLPQEVAAVTADGVAVPYATSWLAARSSLDPELWQHRYEWARRRVLPAAASDWFTVGVWPADLEILERENIGPDRLTRWLEGGGLNLPTALAWLRSGMTVRELESWLDGGWSPTAVDEWRALAFGPEDASLWRTAGFMKAAEARQWNDCGLRPSVGAAWRDAGMGPRQAVQWSDVGLEPTEAVTWEAAGWKLHAALAWVRAGVRSPGLASRLRDHKLGSSEAGKLTRVGVDAEVIESWLEAGWSGSNIGAISGIIGGAIKPWRESGIPIEKWWIWISLFGAESDLAGHWHRAGVPAEALMRLRASDEGLRLERLRAWRAAGFAPKQVLEALNRGQKYPPALTPSAPAPAPVRPRAAQPVTPVRATGEPPPSTRLSPATRIAPSPGPIRSKARAVPNRTNAGFQQWLDDGSEWIKSVGLRASPGDTFLKVLYESGLGWAPMDRALFQIWPEQEWLEEILARAEVLQPRLRLTPSWPAVFESADLTIVLHGGATWARAWVGSNKVGVLVSFRTSDFEVKYSEGDGDARLALGVALCWYLDVRLSLVSTEVHPHFERGGDTAIGSAKSRSTAYVPRAKFRDDVQSVSSGLRSPPHAHRVEGHVRRLGRGRMPSDEARDRAPAWRRLTMGPRDTWVSPHVRGSEENLRQFIVHLNQYSCLADFLGLLGWPKG